MPLFDGTVKKISILDNIARSSVCLTVAVIFALLHWWGSMYDIRGLPVFHHFQKPPSPFCLRRSPDHGTVDVVVVVVVLVGGTTLVFNFFQDTEIFIK